MASVITDFFGLVGISETPPETLAELLPYLFHFVAGCVMVSGVFAAVGRIGSIFMNFRRY